MRNNLLVFFTLTLFTSIVWSQEDYRRWAPPDGVAVRQGHHIEWRNPSSVVRTEGELVGEVAYVWSDCRSCDRDVYLQVITPDGEFKFEENGIVVANGHNRQEDPVVLACDDGGWIIAWEDYHVFEDPLSGLTRNDIYCTKINSQGEQVWGDDEFGVPVSFFRSYKSNIEVVNDGDGGCIVVWRDHRGDDRGDIYAMHITGDGVADERWIENGSPVVLARGDQGYQNAISDGAGGVIVCWNTERSNILAQRLSIEGDLLWGDIAGLPVCTLESHQIEPALCSDGQNGAFIVWTDFRDRDDRRFDIYIQHINGDGNRLWGDQDGGLPLCTDAGSQRDVKIEMSNPGSAIVVWRDSREFEQDFCLYGMKISGNEEMVREWQPEQGIAVAVAEREHANPNLCYDGEEGAYVSWEGGRYDVEVNIYVQRLDSDGQRMWGDGGMVVCGADDEDENGRAGEVISRFANEGCIVSWTDFRLGYSNIYTQRLNPAGDIFWEEDGRPIARGFSNSSGIQRLLPRGNGEFVLVWQDGRFGDQGSVPFVQFCRDEEEIVGFDLEPMGIPVMPPVEGGGSMSDAIISENGSTIVVWTNRPPDQSRSIYLQKIGVNGDFLWDEAGVRCAEYDFDQSHSHICSDGENGVINTWEAANEDEVDDIYIQRISQDGEPLWGESGIQVTDTERNEFIGAIIPDGEGGAVLVWKTYSLETEGDLYIQRVDSDGDKLWGENGRIVCNERNSQSSPNLLRHPDGYVIIWTDGRNAGLNDIYGQFVESDGSFRWGESGFPICSAENHQQYSNATIDNDGNIWVVWVDERWIDSERGKDLYLQKIGNGLDELGRPPLRFPAGDIRVCGAIRDNYRASIVHDGFRGVWIVWRDDRQGGFYSDIYATHINSAGQPFEGWEMDGNLLCGAPYDQQSPQIGLLEPNGDTGCVIVWEDERSKGQETFKNIYVQRLDDDMASVGEMPLVQIPSAYSIDSVYPSPFNSQTIVTITIPKDGQVSLGLFDISGRFIREVSSKWFPSGQHQIPINAENLAAGTYIVKMEAGGFVSDVQVTLIR